MTASTFECPWPNVHMLCMWFLHRHVHKRRGFTGAYPGWGKWGLSLTQQSLPHNYTDCVLFSAPLRQGTFSATKSQHALYPLLAWIARKKGSEIEVSHVVFNNFYKLDFSSQSRGDLVSTASCFVHIVIHVSHSKHSKSSKWKQISSLPPEARSV